jgi:hypothetical protein
VKVVRALLSCILMWSHYLAWTNLHNI